MEKNEAIEAMWQRCEKHAQLPEHQAILCPTCNTQFTKCDSCYPMTKRGPCACPKVLAAWHRKIGF